MFGDTLEPAPESKLLQLDLGHGYAHWIQSDDRAMLPPWVIRACRRPRFTIPVGFVIVRALLVGQRGMEYGT